YATDQGAVRKITPIGVVTTLAGNGIIGQPVDGSGPAAVFGPFNAGITVGSNGNVYVTECPFAIIRQVTPAGVVSTFAGSTGIPGFIDGSGTNAQFSCPVGMATSASGTIYVSEMGNN